MGTQPTQVNCWDVFTWDTTTCSWDTSGSQPNAPMVACYETAVWNPLTCEYDTSSYIPPPPLPGNCWITAVYDSTICQWNLVGSQPVQPAQECWNTVTFDYNSCAWLVTSNVPAPPLPANCYSAAVYDSTICQWNIVGNQPAAPTGLAACETAIFDNATCTWVVTTSAAVLSSCEQFDVIGNWTNNGWSQGPSSNGGTPSSGTGPSSGYGGTGGFLYYETSYPVASTTGSVTVTSECYDISSLAAPALTFQYNMNGISIGTLEVLINGTSVWSLSGDQGTAWNFAQVDLSAYTGAPVVIEFVGTHSGLDYYGDMAIDEVCLTELLIAGCMDSTACNYNASAVLNQGCDFSCLGCSDVVALNYDSTATFNDGSCTYCGGSATATNVVCDVAGSGSTDYISSTSIYTPTTSLFSSCPVTYSVTVPLGYQISGVDIDYSITAASGAYIQEQRSYLRSGSNAEYSLAYTNAGGIVTGGTANYSRSGLSIANGATGVVTFELHAFRTWGSGGLGCAQSTYNLVDDGSVLTVHYEAIITGCMDSSACNYNASANSNDNSCVYISNPVVDMTLGAWTFIGDQLCNGQINTNNSSVTFNNNGTWTFANWSLCDSSLTLYYPNGTVYNGTYSNALSGFSGTISSSSGIAGCFQLYPTVLGCMDSTACNYNTAANLNDNSCIYMSTQPTQINCWDVFTWNTTTCSWDTSGSQPLQPVQVNCWDVFTFNTGTCNWDDTGSLPRSPSLHAIVLAFVCVEFIS